METINRVVDAAVDMATRTIYGPEASHEEKTTQGGSYKPTEHQIRDETTATLPAPEKEIPTQGPNRAIYLNKPIVTSTSETSKLTEESPDFQNLSLRSSSPPLKDTAAIGHRRVDSGIGEEVNIERNPKTSTESGAFQRFGNEKVEDDGIQRTAKEIDNGSHTTEGYPRPIFVGHETSEDDIRRADGRDRVQFDDSKGSTGSLKPSGEPSPERPRQGSAGAIPYMGLGDRGNVPRRARIGTVQGGTVRDRQQELEVAQTAQSGGLGAIPVVFSTSGYDPTGTMQVQKAENDSPNVSGSTTDSDLRQSKDIAEDSTQTELAENSPKPESRHSELTSKPTDKDSTKDSLPKQKAISQSPQSKDYPRPDDSETVGKSHTNSKASQTSTTSVTPQHADEHPSSSIEPHSQGSTSNAATTNDISPIGSGMNNSTHGPAEPSVGTDPTHAQQQTQNHQGRDRPTEEPTEHVPQPSQDQSGAHSEGKEGKKKEAGHLWIKSSGTAADGGDFDASKPGAGKEADRLLEQAGVHRTLDPRQKKGDEGDAKGAKGSHKHDTTKSSGNPANPSHHPDSTGDSGEHGLHLPGILHHHDAKKDGASPEGGSGHKGLGERLEKIKEKVKGRKD